MNERKRRAAFDEGYEMAVDEIRAEFHKGRIAGRSAADKHWANPEEAKPGNGGAYSVVRWMRTDVPKPPDDILHLVYRAAFRQGFNDRIAECKQIVATANGQPITDTDEVAA